jgi:Na+-driven multidrug efflux pump
VGQSLGAKNPLRAEQSAIQALKSGTLWMVLMGIGFFVWRNFLVSIYTTDPEVIRLGEMCMVFVALAQPFQSISIVLGQSLRGAGDTRSTLIYTFVGVWFVRVAFGYLIGIVLGFGFFGMWFAWIGDFIVRATLVWLRFATGKWKTIKV